MIEQKSMTGSRPWQGTGGQAASLTGGLRHRTWDIWPGIINAQYDRGLLETLGQNQIVGKGTTWCRVPVRRVGLFQSPSSMQLGEYCSNYEGRRRTESGFWQSLTSISSSYALAILTLFLQVLKFILNFLFPSFARDLLRSELNRKLTNV